MGAHIRLICLLVLITGCSSPPAPPPPSTPSPVASPTASQTPTPTATEPATPSVDVGALVREATDLSLRGKHEQALVPLEKALAAAPDDPEVHLQLFLCYSSLDPMPGKKSRAYPHAQKVVELVGGARSNKAREYLEAADALGDSKPLTGTGKRPADVTGLEGVKLGMTEEEVKKKLGNRLKPFSGQYANPSKYVPFHIPQYYLGKRPYALLFPFDNETGTLTGLYIRPQKYPSGSPEEFSELEAFFVQLYGPPDGNDDLDNELVSRKRTVWTFPSTEVHVNLYQGMDLSVTYLPLKGKGAEP